MKVILKTSRELVMVSDKKSSNHRGGRLWIKLLVFITSVLKITEIVCTYFHNYFYVLTPSKQTATN